MKTRWAELASTGRSLWRLVFLSAAAVLSNTGTAAELTGEFNWMHDPSRIIKCNGKYFVYYTGDNIRMRYSTDLISWKNGKAVLDKVPDWARQAVPAAKSEFVWAPDIIFLNNKYYLYYSYSTFGSKISVTGLVTSPTLDPESPEYKWTDEGVVLATNNQSDYNAIDAAPILDTKGDLWMSIGSWQAGGIKLVKLDKNTGKPTTEPVTIAARQGAGPEAPYLHYRDGYYYLFINEGSCCNGKNVTYHILVGRSKNVTGPYLDKEGKDLAQGGGTSFLGTQGVEIGPGHMGILSDGDIDRFSYHYYDGRTNGIPTFGIETLVWEPDGWPRPGVSLPGGVYTIASKASGLVLGVQNGRFDIGTLVDQAPDRGGRLQRWNLSPTGDGYYSIGSLGNARYMDLFECNGQDGTKISLYPWANNDCQKWRIEQLSDGSYRIFSKGGGSALTLPGGTNTVQAAVQGFAWKGGASQSWIFKTSPWK